MDLSRLNLNLLVALEALLLESHVTRAGEHIHVSQAAMSAMLKQLRDIYGDPLLVRGQGSRMQLTPFATKLLPLVQQALRQVEKAFSGHDEFQPALSERTFYVGMSDYLATIILPKLMYYLAKQAPHIKLIVQHLNYLRDSQPLVSGELDLVLGNFPNLPDSLYQQTLFEDKPVCVASKSHPAFCKARFTLQDFLKYPHIMVSFVPVPGDTFIDHVMRQLGYPSPVTVSVPYATMALYSLPGTLYITSTVERMAKPFLKPLKLSMKKMPFKIPESIAPPNYIAKQYWHERHHTDPGHQWFRQLIKSISSHKV